MAKSPCCWIYVNVNCPCCCNRLTCGRQERQRHSRHREEFVCLVHTFVSLLLLFVLVFVSLEPTHNYSVEWKVPEYLARLARPQPSQDNSLRAPTLLCSPTGQAKRPRTSELIFPFLRHFSPLATSDNQGIPQSLSGSSLTA